MQTIDLQFTKSINRPTGNTVTSKRLRLINNLINQQSQIEKFERGGWNPRMWFWQIEDGSYLFEVRYGRSAIELQKGKTAIKCGDLKHLRASIEEVITKTRSGALDKLILDRSDEIRQNFKKKT
ncbi:hypothetical protein LSUCC1028_00370 [Rhodobacterales bacterium LSUCC1028]|nr:hypothetical protein [Rhodobacterales bacterium LSUCC1028]